jgi:hypothetical protein
VEETLLAFSTRYYLFQNPIVIFQDPPCNKTKGLSNAETRVIFPIIWNNGFYQLFYY